MKRCISLLFLTLIFSNKILAQDDDTFSPSRLESIAANLNVIINDGDADFKITTTPDKWKNESGVIIAQKTNFSFDKDANKLAVYEMTHRRIKLLDRDAVNKYSSVFSELDLQEMEQL